MARSVILKARVSPEEYDALIGRLKPSQTLSDLIRDQLGVDGNRHGQTAIAVSPISDLPRAEYSALGKKPCPHPGYCALRRGKFCTLGHYTPACPLGAEAWELL